jgi:hypothetical protein
MIPIEIERKDLKELARIEVHNLPGVLFAGTSPLLKPFMKKLEELLPAERRGQGEAYVLSALHSHIGEVHASENSILVKSGEKAVEIRREELGALMGERYPSTDHHRLNLPGLLFLQGSPALQTTCTAKLRRDHSLRIPEGRRTLRYIFHLGVVLLDADKDKILVSFDPGRLPRKADGSCVLE